MNYGSLFTGIGTADYAAALLGWNCVFQSEIEPYPARISQQRFGGVQLGDITTADFTQFAGLVDLVVGGFPCQDISAAGKSTGIDGARSSLWQHMHRCIEAIRPRYAIIENSNRLPGSGLDKILCDLASIGYDAEWRPISAAGYGASHLRERTWILAYPHGQRRTGLLLLLAAISRTPHGFPISEEIHSIGTSFHRFAQGYGEPPVFGAYDGFTARLHVKPRIKAIGNAMYWPIPYSIFKAIEWADACSDAEWLTANHQALQLLTYGHPLRVPQTQATP